MPRRGREVDPDAEYPTPVVAVRKVVLLIPDLRHRLPGRPVELQLDDVDVVRGLHHEVYPPVRSSHLRLSLRADQRQKYVDGVVEVVLVISLIHI